MRCSTRRRPRRGLRLGIGVATLALWLAVAAGCEEELPPPPPGMVPEDAPCREGSATIDVEDEVAPEVSCVLPEANIVCAGDWATLCNANRAVVDSTNCRLTDEKCYERECDDPRDCPRCLACKPNAVRCGEDGERERCRDDGSGYEPEEPCDEAAGLYCDALSGQCADLCAEAEAARSYIGCEYYAVSTSNSQLALTGVSDDGICNPFSFAIVVANGESVPARVTIETPDGDVLERTVDPARTVAINLPCSLELTGMGDRFDEAGEEIPRVSSLGESAAHHITSNVPITVYQFNPLEFESELSSDTVYSYTNDASLLLPVSSLTTSYMATTVPTLLHLLDLERFEEPPRLVGPGFITIVGTTDEPAEVEIRTTSYTLPGADDALLPALEPGDTFTITLERGQVAQILSAPPDDCEGDEYDVYPDGRRYFCKVPRDYDLTGTRISSTEPVLVISGHDCAFVPYDRWACDHVEEVMQPLESWGKDIIVSQSHQPDCHEPQPNMIRVVASHDDTEVRFEPEIHEDVTLDDGDVLELLIEEDVRVVGDKGISVSQLLVGEDFDGEETSSYTKGDPSLSLAIPSEQWRKRYSILSPETFTDNFVSIIAREEQIVLLNGRVVTRMKPLEGTPFVTAQLQIPGGQHTLESSQPFGVTVYGYARYTSYMVPGGLDFNLINPPE